MSYSIYEVEGMPIGEIIRYLGRLRGADEDLRLSVMIELNKSRLLYPADSALVNNEYFQSLYLTPDDILKERLNEYYVSDSTQFTRLDTILLLTSFQGSPIALTLVGKHASDNVIEQIIYLPDIGAVQIQGLYNGILQSNRKNKFIGIIQDLDFPIAYDVLTDDAVISILLNIDFQELPKYYNISTQFRRVLEDPIAISLIAKKHNLPTAKSLDELIYNYKESKFAMKCTDLYQKSNRFKSGGIVRCNMEEPIEYLERALQVNSPDIVNKGMRLMRGSVFNKYYDELYELTQKYSNEAANDLGWHLSRKERRQ